MRSAAPQSPRSLSKNEPMWSAACPQWLRPCHSLFAFVLPFAVVPSVQLPCEQCVLHGGGFATRPEVPTSFNRSPAVFRATRHEVPTSFHRSHAVFGGVFILPGWPRPVPRAAFCTSRRSPRVGIEGCWCNLPARGLSGCWPGATVFSTVVQLCCTIAAQWPPPPPVPFPPAPVLSGGATDN